MRSTMVAIAALLVTAAGFGDPHSAIVHARQQMDRSDCYGAVHTLQDAIPEAAALSDLKQRGDAVAAIHFYTALAFSNCAQPQKAKEQLREFFRFHPGHSSLDRAKFPTRFIQLFDETQRVLGTGEMFERFYPGFNEFADFVEEQRSLQLWGTSPAFQLLAAQEERDHWGRCRDDVERAEFIARFWRRRDPDPMTSANELRESMVRRVEFADRHFMAPDEFRGAMSDRGRVFVLLGTPARVYRQGLRRYETTIVSQRARTPLTGILERWVYFRPQLPPGIAVQQVEFRFITQPGYGEHVMQRDFWALKALGEARKIRDETRPSAE